MLKVRKNCVPSADMIPFGITAQRITGAGLEVYLKARELDHHWQVFLTKDATASAVDALVIGRL